MTYRELLKLYKQGKLEDSTKKQIEAEIEKQDAISEFLYEEGAIPDFSDLESGRDYFDDLNDKKQWTERQNSKTEDNVEKQSENRIIEKSKSAGDSRNQQEDEFNRQFIKEIQRFIRRAFIKMGLAVGVVVLAVVLSAVFILPKAVSEFYYNPNEAAGQYEEMTTTRMNLDLSVYSELFLPGNHRDQVSAVSRGYGEYDIVIPQTSSWTGKFTSVSGRLVRGKLTLYDNNVLSRPIMQFYLPGDEDAWAAWEVDENGKETKMDTEARKEASIQDSKETIADYNDNDWYLAYVSINDIMDYKDFIEWFQNLSNQKELEWGALWCAVHTEDEDGYCVEPNIGFCPLPSGMSVSWDREKYPYLSLLDNSDLSHVAEANDEETMQTHFTSMLSYIQDHDDILSMMGQTTDSPNRYQDMINFVQKNGLKIHGFAVSAKKKALLELYKEDVVSYIQTTPQNLERSETMEITEMLDELKSKARRDEKLRAELLETRKNAQPLSAFCRKCRELGYEIYDMDLITAGEEFYATMRRSTNGGGENSPMLEGEDDFYELFFAGLE